MTVLLVAAGGAVGATIRFMTNAFLARSDPRIPLATLTVNLIGSLALGVLAGRVAGGTVGADAFAAMGTGGLAGLTTFSTFAVESERLGDGRELAATIYVVVTITGSVLLATLGWTLGRP